MCPSCGWWLASHYFCRSDDCHSATPEMADLRITASEAALERYDGFGGPEPLRSVAPTNASGDSSRGWSRAPCVHCSNSMRPVTWAFSARSWIEPSLGSSWHNPGLQRAAQQEAGDRRVGTHSAPTRGTNPDVGQT